MNKFMSGLEKNTNFTKTENGALAHKTTQSDLLDMFALGGSMRKRSEEDIILMFRKAFAENPLYALKCLFYLRDIRNGQGERRFFRICMKDLAKQEPQVARRNIPEIPIFGRWDDLYLFVGTPAEEDAFQLIKSQLILDTLSETPSLLGKWLKSENTSSPESVKLATYTRRKYLNLSSKQYRQILSSLRARINIVERLMSENRWEEIQFDKVPSKAGLIYKNAFARREIIKEKYEQFIKNKNTKVNAKALYPYEVIEKALQHKVSNSFMGEVLQKYWDSLTDHFKGSSFNALAIADTSASIENLILGKVGYELMMEKLKDERYSRIG